MKRDELVRRAFRNLQSVIRACMQSGSYPNRSVLPTIVTLAWVLDVIPPMIDESVTDRLIGDPRKNVAGDAEGMVDFLVNVEV